VKHSGLLLFKSQRIDKVESGRALRRVPDSKPSLIKLVKMRASVCEGRAELVQ
jgi:hypothetical protein